MDKNDYNLSKLFKYINKRTIGLKFHGSRHDILNKFGILYDLLNKESNDWNQTVSVETGSQLLNFFDFKKKNNKESIFFSTTRIGFTYTDLLDKNSNTKTDFHNKLNTFREIYDNLMNVFNYLKFDRFGIYFEIPLTKKEISEFSKLKLLKGFTGNLLITDFDEINSRTGIILNKFDSSIYQKIIMSIGKVIDQNNPKADIKYLLTIDYQDYFLPIEITTAQELESFLQEKLNIVYDQMNSYLVNLCTTEETK